MPCQHERMPAKAVLLRRARGDYSQLHMTEPSPALIAPSNGGKYISKSVRSSTSSDTAFRLVSSALPGISRSAGGERVGPCSVGQVSREISRRRGERVWVSGRAVSRTVVGDEVLGVGNDAGALNPRDRRPAQRVAEKRVLARQV